MANLNKVMLIGNLVADPELRYTPKGTAVTDIGMAMNRQWTNDQGQRQEETTFVDVTLWGRQAEVAGQSPSIGIIHQWRNTRATICTFQTVNPIEHALMRTFGDLLQLLLFDSPETSEDFFEPLARRASIVLPLGVPVTH